MLLDDIESVLQAIQIKQSKYKYDFITEIKYNQKTHGLFRGYSIIKYHTEVLDGKRRKIQDVAKRGRLVEILTWLAEELKAVDSYE